MTPTVCCDTLAGTMVAGIDRTWQASTGQTISDASIQI